MGPGRKSLRKKSESKQPCAKDYLAKQIHFFQFEVSYLESHAFAQIH